MENSSKEQKRAILRSTSLLGGSSFINILVGMVRTKIVAILLGPAGIGFMGVLNGLQQIILTVTGLGLGSSGVRQIASAFGSKDEYKISIIVKTLRLLVILTGVIGLLVMVIGSKFWSQLSFNKSDYAPSISLLGFSVLFSAISSGQSCVLQGFRRISDVAKINIIGAFNSTIIALPCYVIWGLDGVIPSFVLGSLAMLATSRWYAKKVIIAPAKVNLPIMLNEGSRLVFLGGPIMLSALISSGTTYFIRVFISREAGLNAVGQYQAAFNLAGVLVNFVLGAMGTDYYPRLTSIADDDTKINAEVNNQTEIALLLASPALGLTLLLMPIAMNLFYSSHFDEAIPILRWAVFGVLGRVISWPMGFILLAKAKGAIFFGCELISGIFNVLSVFICYRLIGIQGTGLAFALLYVFYICLMLVVSNKLAHVKWNGSNKYLVVLSIGFLATLAAVHLLATSELVKYSIGSVILLLMGYLFFRRLMHVTGHKFSSFIKLQKL